MKKVILYLMLIVGCLSTGYAQLSGIKSIPGDFATIESAISALNSGGVGTGGVTFNISAGYTETFLSPTGGLITATGASSNPIVFQKSGTGANPVILAGTGTGTTDYVIGLSGTDYITFDGIDIRENPLNTTTTQMAEWGYALLKSSATDGSQYVTIKNCDIRLSNLNTASYGIYSDNVTPAAPTIQLTVTALSGANSYNKLYGNHISQCGGGIYLSGYTDWSSPYVYYDQNNEIGKDGPNQIDSLGSTTGTIYGVYAKCQNNLIITRNSFTGNAATTYYGIFTLAGNNSNVEITNNTIRIHFIVSASNLTGISNGMGGSGTNNTVNISGNHLVGNTMPLASTGQFTGIANTASCYHLLCNSNMVDSNTIGSTGATSTGTFTAMSFSGGSSLVGSSWDIYSNSISNNKRLQFNTNIATNNLLYFTGGAKTTNVNNNILTNNVFSSNGITDMFYCSVWGTTMNIYGNEFTNVETGGGTIYGMLLSSLSAANIHDNKILNLLSNGVSVYGSPARVNGIYFDITMATANVYNNIVGDLQAPFSDYQKAILALNLGPLTSCSVLGNTFYINGTSSVDNFGTYVIYANAMCPLDLRNNILVNTSTPTGYGKSYLISRSYSDMGTLLVTNNNNDLYMGPYSEAKIFFEDGTYQIGNLEDYKGLFYPRETVSFSENPPFVNIGSHPYDLHIKTNVATQCESGGQVITAPVAVNVDIDANPRFPNMGYPNNGTSPAFAPDAGADEFGGINKDLLAPIIVVTPLLNTSSLAARTLQVTITDAGGIPSSGIGLPRLYWSKNSSTTWNYATGVAGTGDQYTFSFGSGVALGDTIHYYIVAQDNAPTPNVSAFPGYGCLNYSANPPHCSAPSTPLMYRIIGSISGIIPVGVGQVYSTLTNACTDISDKEFVGPVTLLLTDNNYPSETFPIVIEPAVGLDAVNTLTIHPATGKTPVISGNSSTGILKINGANYVFIDGSNAGSTDRSITWENTSSANNTYTIGFYNKNGVGASHCILKNCVVKSTPQLSNVTIAVSFDLTGGKYNHNVIANNKVCSAKFGIYLRGANGGVASNCSILNNTIGSTVPGEEISYRGISTFIVDSTLISGNDIFGSLTGNTNYGQAGIYLFGGSTNTLVQRNIIHDWYYNGTTDYANYGIYYASDATTVTEIANNIFYNIKSPGKSTGIQFGTGGNAHIYHNTFDFEGNYLSPTRTTWSACIYANAPITLLDIRDNIIKNTLQPSSENPNVSTYAIYTTGTSSIFSTIDFNDYYVNGTNAFIGYLGGQQKTLAQWQAVTGQDVSSKDLDPVFVSASDMHPTNDLLKNQGFYLASVPADFNNDLHSNPPDMGAFNFGVDPLVITNAATNVLFNSATLNGTVNPNTVITTASFDYGLTTSYGSTIAAIPGTVSGTTPVGITAVPANLHYMTTYHFRAHGIDPSGVHFYGQDMTFTTPPAPPTVVTLTATGVSATTATLNGTANANNSATNVFFEYGLTTSYGTQVVASPANLSDTTVTPESVNLASLLPNATYHYRILATNIAGTSYGNDMTFTTPAIQANVVTNLATSIGSNSVQLNGTVTANNATTTVTFEYGTTTSYGSLTNATPASVTGMTPTAVSASVSGLLINTTYHFRCVGANVAGTAYGQDQVFTTNCMEPVITINGPDSACAGMSGYQYTTEAGNSNYQWTVSPGGTITSGAGTNVITVSWNTTGSQNVTVNYINQYNCSASIPASLNVLVSATPVPTISGPATACQSSSDNIYTTENGMSGYTWTVAGGTITSGNNTSSVTVTWSTTGPQTISVNYANAAGCYALTPASMSVTVNQLPAPIITGPSEVCANSGINNYSTETGMTGYNWTISPGGTIVSGQGTASVQVSWTTAGSQTLSVNYANSFGCFAVNSTSFSVTVNAVPDAAGTIAGTSEVCGGSQGVGFSCALISGATYYVWTVPTGATIASGSGTNAITVDFAADASSGVITVYGNNICGNGAVSPDFPVTVNVLPGDPGTIAGDSSVCEGESGVSYSVAPITGATTYTWTVPGGATIVSGASTSSILVDFAMGATSGPVTVSGSNSCGTGSTSSLPVTVNPIPETPVVTVSGFDLTSSVATGNQWYQDGNLIPGATDQTYTATASGWYWTIVTVNECSSAESNHEYILITGVNEQPSPIQCRIAPNPCEGQFTLMTEGLTTGHCSVSILNALGASVWEGGFQSSTGLNITNIDPGDLASGMYTVIIRDAKMPIIRKLIVK